MERYSSSIYKKGIPTGRKRSYVFIGPTCDNLILTTPNRVYNLG